MIAAGVLLLLFVAYQLWGTGLHEARAQDSLEDRFTELVGTPSTVPASTPPATAPPASSAATTTTREAQPDVVQVAFDNGDAVARLRIPKIGLDKIVVEGVDVEDLRKAPGHYKSTSMPGQQGNAAIAGHRTTYGAPFGDIDKLVPGDEILVATPQGSFTYKVIAQTGADGSTSGHLIVDPSEVWVLDDVGDSRLTLTACHPKYSARQRIVVQASLVEPPLPKPPPLPSSSPEPTPTAPTDPAATLNDAELDLGKWPRWRSHTADANGGVGCSHRAAPGLHRSSHQEPGKARQLGPWRSATVPGGVRILRTPRPPAACSMRSCRDAAATGCGYSPLGSRVCAR